MSTMKNKSILLIILTLIIGWYLVIPKEEEFELPVFTPSDLRATLVHPSLVGKTEHTIPNFTFINQDSLTITQDTVEGKIYVVDFFFTSCPSICIDLTKNLKFVQEAFKDSDDVFILSHSVDPKYDTVSRLKNMEKFIILTQKNGFFSVEQ